MPGRFLTLIALSFLIAGCSSVKDLPRDPDLGTAERLALASPDDPMHQRNLGIALFRVKRYGAAEERLRRSLDMWEGEPDSRLLFYLGVTVESQGRTTDALEAYRRYSALPENDKYAKYMKGRFFMLSQELAQEAVKERIQNEVNLGEVNPAAIAVFPFKYTGKDPKYEPIGVGLGALLSNDLAVVQDILVVERIRLTALTDEIDLGTDGYVDGETAPRSGRLIGAGQILGGNISVQDAQDLTMTTTLTWVSGLEHLNQVIPTEDQLQRFFDVEKELVFQVLDSLGIEPTEQERTTIMGQRPSNMEAFLAYSRGLLEEDKRRFGAAAEQYRISTDLDPAFGPAADGFQRTSSIVSTMDAGWPDITATVEALDPVVIARDMREILITSRLQNIGVGIGTILLPQSLGTERSFGTGSGLPGPPDPPGGR